ncbi:MAG: winged helix-turn-helix transcriptional regulator [Candidatus Woesearchaeota archaeon]
MLSLIKNDGRFEYTSIAQKLDLDSRTIRSKVKNLMQKGILQGFTTLLDLKKLDMQLHKLCIYLNDHKKEKISKLINYLKLNPRTIHLIKSLELMGFGS